jgi:hypothetical protein
MSTVVRKPPFARTVKGFTVPRLQFRVGRNGSKARAFLGSYLGEATSRPSSSGTPQHPQPTANRELRTANCEPLTEQLRQLFPE